MYLGELLRRFVVDENGQDLVEYGLLASIIGIASLLAYQAIPAKMETAFKGWSTGVYNLWVPDDPIVTP
jgi:Flp pilus assembly pilin Flp